jgi:hypothetical protein
MKKRKERPLFPATGAMEGPIRENIAVDPLGSYTGITAEPGEVPVQDADDL